MGTDAAPFAKYDADGSGRDTYIRRDPVAAYGKSLYKPEPRLVTRMGAAGSAIPRGRPRKPGELDEVGGPQNSGFPFERPARFLPPKPEGYPVEVTHYTSMNELIQNAFVANKDTVAATAPKRASGWQGFHPRCPPAVGAANWATVRRRHRRRAACVRFFFSAC